MLSYFPYRWYLNKRKQIWVIHQGCLSRNGQSVRIVRIVQFVRRMSYGVTLEVIMAISVRFYVAGCYVVAKIL
jgi:hypothetical protein